MFKFLVGIVIPTRSLGGDPMSKEILGKLELSEVNSGVFYGEWMPIDGRGLISSHSPIDGKEIAKVTIAGREDYEMVIKRAQKSFDVWREIPAPERGQIIREIGDELRQKRKH